MNTFEKLAGTAFALVFVYLLVANHSGATDVIQSLSGFSTNILKTLQGRG